MDDVRNRIEIMHGVNLDQLGRRDPAHYGSGTLTELERVRERGDQREAEETEVRMTFALAPGDAGLDLDLGLEP